MAWDEVCKPKKYGGLGLRQAQVQNKAFLMKLGWHLVNRKEAFWVKVIRDKYNCGPDLMPRMDSRKPCSNTWQGIKNIWDKFKDAIDVDGRDQASWRPAKNGDFTVKSAYNLLCCENNQEDPLWSRIWKLRVPERCKMFTWIAVRKRLLTNAARKKRGISDVDTCQVCNTGIEDQLHVLRDCPHTRVIWQSLVHPSMHVRFFSMDFSQWIRRNLMRKENLEQEAWGATFVITCWWIWRRRNLFIFEEKNVTNEILVASIKAMVASIAEAHDRFCKGTLSSFEASKRILQWVPPEEGQIKINVDGAFSHQSQAASCGGVLRDHNGSLVRGFMCRMMEGDTLTAELWGIVHGLKIAWDMGFRNIVLESDSAEACSLVNEDAGGVHVDRRLIDEAKQLKGREWSTTIKQVSRWSNQAADYLAKQSLSAAPGFHIISDEDERLKSIMMKDLVM